MKDEAIKKDQRTWGEYLVLLYRNKLNSHELNYDEFSYHDMDAE